MDSIAITKANMGALPQDRPELSPFGILSQAFSQELLARTGFQEGRWPFVPLDLLEEGEEAPASAPPVQPVVQVDLKLMLQTMRQLDIRTEKAVDRVVERILHLREQGRPHPAQVPPAPRGGGRNRAAGEKSQTAGAGASGGGQVQGGPRNAAPEPGRDGDGPAAQTPEPPLPAAGSFAQLQNFYNTIHQHLQFIANLRQPGLWRPEGQLLSREALNGMGGRPVERLRQTHGLRRAQGRLPVPPAAFAGGPSRAWERMPLAAGDAFGLPGDDTARRGMAYLAAGELACLEDGAEGAGTDGAAEAAAKSRELRRMAEGLERAIAGQALRSGAWRSMGSARTLSSDVLRPGRLARGLSSDVFGPGRSARGLSSDAWDPGRLARAVSDARELMYAAQTPRPDAPRPVRPAWAFSLDTRDRMPGLDLWRQRAGEERPGQAGEAGEASPSARRRLHGAEAPAPEGEKAALAPAGGAPSMGTATPAQRAHWGETLGKTSRLSGPSGHPGAGEAVSAPLRDGPIPALPMGGELAHRLAPEEDNPPRQVDAKPGPERRSAVESRAASPAASRPAPGSQGRAALGPEGLTAGKSGPAGAEAPASADRPAAGPGGLTAAASLEAVRQGPSVLGMRPETAGREGPAQPPFSQMPGEELAHRAVPAGPEQEAAPMGRARGSADKTRVSAEKAQTSVDKARTSAGRAQASTDEARTFAGGGKPSAGGAQISTGGTQTVTGGARSSPDAPSRSLEGADGTERQRAGLTAVRPKPLGAARDIRTVKAERRAAALGETLPQGSAQAGQPLPALFGPGAELVYPADARPDGASAPAEAGTDAAHGKGQRPQTDVSQGRARRAAPAAQTGGQSAAPGLGILPVEDMIYGAPGGGAAGAGAETPREGQTAAPEQGMLPVEDMIYGAQGADGAGAGPETRAFAAPEAAGPAALDGAERMAPPPLELAYGSTAQPAADTPDPAAKGRKPVRGSMESDYVRGLPDWAKRFLQEGAPQSREEAVRRLGADREQAMGTAQNIAVLPSFSEGAGTAFQWTAPDARAPAPVEYREPRRQQEPPQPQSVRISEAEVQRTADRVYRMIEDRIRRERWRLGL